MAPAAVETSCRVGGHLLRARRERLGRARDVQRGRIEIGDQRAETGRHAPEGARQLAQLVVGLEGELVTQLTTRHAIGLPGEAGDAAREVRRAEECERHGDRERDGAVDQQVEHRGAGLGDESVGAAGDDERADDPLVGHDRDGGAERAVEAEVVDAGGGGASRGDRVREVAGRRPFAVGHLIAVAVRDEVEAPRGVARDELDGKQIVSVAEGGGVLDAGAANQIAHVAAGEVRVGRDARAPRRARRTRAARPARARARSRTRAYVGKSRTASVSTTAVAGERGHLEPHGETGRGSQESEGQRVEGYCERGTLDGGPKLRSTRHRERRSHRLCRPHAED